jgi:hypothetical protein
MASNFERHDASGEADLIGYHLGLCDQQQREEIQQALHASPELSKRLSRLAATLAPLNADTPETPPIDLNQRILSRIEATHRTIKLSPAAASEHGSGSHPLLTLRELMGLAAAIAIFVGIFVPGYRTARMAARQAVCSNNLRQISGGYAKYAMVHDGHMPFVGAASGNAAWLAGDGMEMPVLRNSRNVFQLVRGGFTPGSAFVCPDRAGDRVLQIGDLSRLSDFPNPRNNSYATNLMIIPWRQGELSPLMPVAADMTPLVDENRHLLRDRQPPENSQSHADANGQNVLRSDGSALFFRTPRVGVENDDIYRVVGVQRYTGVERPQLRSDAFLVP